MLKRVNTIIAKESHLDIGQFKISLRKDTDFSTTAYLNLEFTPRGNYQTEAAFPTMVISGHAIPTRSAPVSQLPRSGAMGAIAPLATVVRPFIATSTVAPGLPSLRSTTSAHGARLISGGAMGAASVLTATKSFAAPTTTPGLPTATATATPAMSATAMPAVRDKHLAPAPETPEPAHHARRVEHRLDGSRFNRLTGRVQSLQDQ